MKCKIMDTGYQYKNYATFFDVRSIEGKNRFNSDRANIHKFDILSIKTQALHEYNGKMIYVVEKNKYYALIEEKGIEIIKTCIQK